MKAAPALVVVVLALAAGCGPGQKALPGAADELAPSTEAKVDNFGYRPYDPKVAVFSADPGAIIEVRTKGRERVLSLTVDGGSIRSKGTDPASGDRVWWVDLSSLTAPGTYHLWSPSLRARSYDFVIADDVYGELMRAATRTFYLQRCGIAKTTAVAGSWADEFVCHRADAATGPAPGHQNRGLLDLAGGWHDAGDYNKYVWYSVSNAILYLLYAFESDPGAFPDGGLHIPESGNGISDLLDEVKWELDFLLKMQLADGSVLSRVHAEGFANGPSPPSADQALRYYENPTLDAGAVFAGSCALSSRTFAAAGQRAYAVVLKKAASKTWDWLLGQGHSSERVWAAAEVFRMDPTNTAARSYVDGYQDWSKAALPPGRYETHAAVTYVQTRAATASVVAAMRTQIARQVDDIFAADDLYRNGMPARWYHWGSNSVKAASGVFLLDAARLGATGSHTATACRAHALDFLHHFHGQNPLSMVYLTNMASLGGEHSSWQLFHNWFGQSSSAHSRGRYVGKPSAIVESHYPYFEGSDNHNVRDDKVSSVGPPPGFVPGGPNQYYSGDATPPRGTSYPSRFYRDWNDQVAWTARTWEITESSIGYQGPYVALVAAFTRR